MLAARTYASNAVRSCWDGLAEMLAAFLKPTPSRVPIGEGVGRLRAVLARFPTPSHGGQVKDPARPGPERLSSARHSAGRRHADPVPLGEPELLDEAGRADVHATTLRGLHVAHFRVATVLRGAAYATPSPVVKPAPVLQAIATRFDRLAGVKKPAKSLTERAKRVVAEEGFEPPTQGL